MDTHARVRMLAGGMIVAGFLGILALWILPKATSTNGPTMHARHVGADDRP
jgi:hypothetical protein